MADVCAIQSWYCLTETVLQMVPGTKVINKKLKESCYNYFINFIKCLH